MNTDNLNRFVLVPFEVTESIISDPNDFALCLCDELGSQLTGISMLAKAIYLSRKNEHTPNISALIELTTHIQEAEKQLQQVTRCLQRQNSNQS